MALLSHLLAQPNLGLRLIKAGSSDPEISWVSTTELHDLSEYLEGGEVLLTTGLAFTHEDPRWRDFVAAMSRAQIAAIGFGIGVTHHATPQELIRAATQYQVALFEIPLPTPFIAISKAVAGLIRTDELRAARNALNAQEKLFNGARADLNPAEILSVIAQATGRHLALVTTDHTIIASTAGYKTHTSPTEYIELGSDHRHRLSITGDTPLTPEGNSIIAAGALVLSFGLHGGRTDQHRERERWERFTQGLLDGTQTPAALHILSPQLAGNEHLNQVRAIALQGSAEAVAEWRRQPRSGLDRLVTPDTTTPRPTGLGVAWQVCPDSDEHIDRALATAAAYDLDAVIGRAVPPQNTPTSRRSVTARLSALSPTAALYRQPRIPDTIWADRDAPILETLLTLTETGTARQLSQQVLGPLSYFAHAQGPAPAPANTAAPSSQKALTNDALTETERDTLRDTLTAFFIQDGQRGPAASALGIHRNTLRDRLTRIERITGRSLANPDDRAELWFALRLETTS